MAFASVAPTPELDRAVLAEPLLTSWRPDVDAPRARDPHGVSTSDVWPVSDLASFTRGLRDAEILDAGMAGVPGASILLPYGSRMAALFRRKVREHFLGAGLEEHEYPNLISDRLFAPMRSLLALEDRVLQVGTASDRKTARSRGSLLPTGEPIVYSHWKSFLRTADDLPIRMFRQAVNFRPARAGGNLFRPAESPDVFELHCAHAEEREHREVLRSLLGVLQATVQAFGVPALWTTRPPWTNHGSLFAASFAADTPTPFGSTIFCGALYDQAQIASRAFGLSYRENGAVRRPWQINGAVSRRLLLCHLLIGCMGKENGLLIAPDLSPDQVRIRLLTECARDEEELNRLARRLGEGGVRVDVRRVESKRRLLQAGSLGRAQGVPLRLSVLGRRAPGDPFKIISECSGREGEHVLLIPDLTKLVEHVGSELDFVARRQRERSRALFRHWTSTVTSPAEAREAMQAGTVAVFAAEPSRNVADAVASWRCGEVLGYADAGDTAECVFSGRPTRSVAVASRRM